MLYSVHAVYHPTPTPRSLASALFARSGDATGWSQVSRPHGLPGVRPCMLYAVPNTTRSGEPCTAVPAGPTQDNLMHDSDAVCRRGAVVGQHTLSYPRPGVHGPDAATKAVRSWALLSWVLDTAMAVAVCTAVPFQSGVGRRASSAEAGHSRSADWRARARAAAEACVGSTMVPIAKPMA